MTWWEELKVQRPSGWDKLKILSGTIAAVLVPVAVVWVGQIYTQAVKERELQGKFVELAVGILQEKPNEQQPNLRSWAADVLDTYSGVPMSDDARVELRESSLPIGRDALTFFDKSGLTLFDQSGLGFGLYYEAEDLALCLQELGFVDEKDIDFEKDHVDAISAAIERGLREYLSSITAPTQPRWMQMRDRSGMSFIINSEQLAWECAALGIHGRPLSSYE